MEKTVNLCEPDWDLEQPSDVDLAKLLSEELSKLTNKPATSFTHLFTPGFFYETPVLISLHHPTLKDRKLDLDSIKGPIEQFYPTGMYEEFFQNYSLYLKDYLGYYPSLNEFLRMCNGGEIRLMKKISEENWESVSNHIYNRQKQIYVFPSGLVYKYGVMDRGNDLRYGEGIKIANVEYIVESILNKCN